MNQPSSLGSQALAVCTLSAPAFADPVNVVAAENFYGDMASQIGRRECRGDQHPLQSR